MNIGIIGGGQLGWMMILEGRKLGYGFNCIDSDFSKPGVRIADMGYTYDQYRDFVDSSDLVTYEFEHVDDRVLDYADSCGKLRPGMLPIKLKRDRSLEKEFLRDAGLPVAPFKVVHTPEELRKASLEYERSIAKSAMGGYDGKGQYPVSPGMIPEEMPPGKYVLEEFVDFSEEASIIASRDIHGKMAFHTASLNVNMKGMLVYNVAPFPDRGMKDVSRKLLEKLDYTGVMGIEFFIRNGKPMINEFSPRVHNSGHHTLLGSSVSQFEQHVRAITGLPVPEPVLLSASGIVNIIGKTLTEDLKNKILEIPGTQIYWYGKDNAKKRRKVGHVNVVAGSAQEVKDRINDLIDILYGNRILEFLEYS
ncbi:MAG: 5-(carboxyamino)imidazole ribonucleotide synthase [Thermoplasmataceae archaeon]